MAITKDRTLWDRGIYKDYGSDRDLESFRKEYMPEFAPSSAAGTLAANPVQVHVGQLELMRDRNAHALAHEKVSQEVEKISPHCQGCTNYRLVSNRSPMTDAITVEARCKERHCTQFKIGKADVSAMMQEWVELPPNTLGAKRTWNSDKLDAQSYAMAAAQIMEPFQFPTTTISSEDTPESSPADTW